MPLFDTFQFSRSEPTDDLIIVACLVLRALYLAGLNAPSRHSYTPLPIAYLERRGVTSLDDDVRDSDVTTEGGGAMRVTYTAAGCCVSPVRVGAESGFGAKQLGEERSNARLRRLLCCRKRDQVRSIRLFANEH